MRKSSAFLLVILLLAVTALAACGGAKTGDNGAGSGTGTTTPPASGSNTQEPAAGGLERVKAAGVLKIGIDASYPPMEFVDKDGKTPIGFDVDLAKKIAEKLGVKAEHVIIDWNGIQTGLLSGHYDAIISSMTITEERQKEMDFVEYIRMGIAFASRNGVEVKTEADLNDKVVVVQAETTAHFYLEELKDLKMKEFKSFPYATDAFRELENGLADVVVIDEPVAGYYAKLDPSKYTVTGTASLEPDPIGIALRKEDTELNKAIAQAVADLKADGTIKQLSEQWFGGELGQ